MERIRAFDPQHLEAVYRVLADTDLGLTGSEIGCLLREIRISDISPDATKWKRLFNAFVGAQNQYQVGNHLIMFVNRALAPVSYARKREAFEWRRGELNVVLAFSGFFVREDGRVGHSAQESTLDGARQRTGRMHAAFERRNVHAEVLRYCRAELVHENYFHAILEAVKGVAERIRQLSGLVPDGSQLTQEALGSTTSILAINPLLTHSEKSEQRGFVHLLTGLFGMVRNPLAHAPKVVWPMTELDALDILTFVSLVHRKLDGTKKIRRQRSRC